MNDPSAFCCQSTVACYAHIMADDLTNIAIAGRTGAFTAQLQAAPVQVTGEASYFSAGSDSRGRAPGRRRSLPLRPGTGSGSIGAPTATGSDTW